MLKLIAEDWAQLWPNVFALSIWTVLMFAWHHFSLKKHITAKHDEMKEHVIAVAGQPPRDDLSSENEEGP